VRSSTVSNLADEGFAVVVVEDCCAATMDPHRHDLGIINMICCHVATLDEVLGFFA
jgi:nicotinamidase-related amidase